MDWLASSSDTVKTLFWIVGGPLALGVIYGVIALIFVGIPKVVRYWYQQYQHWQWGARLRYVEKLKDQADLIEFALNDEDSDVRKAAVVKILDQAILTNIAKNDEDSGVRKAALEKITDQTALVEFVKNDKDLGVQRIAISKLTNRQIQIVSAEYLSNLQRAIQQHIVKGTSVFADQPLLRCVITFAGAAPECEGLKDLFNAVKDIELPTKIIPLWVAADCLELAPTGTAIQELEKSARQLLSSVNLNRNQSNGHKSDSDDEYGKREKATAAVLSALGACETCRDKFTDFVADDKLLIQQKELIEERQQMMLSFGMSDEEMKMLIKRIKQVNLAEFIHLGRQRLASSGISDKEIDIWPEKLEKIVSYDSLIQEIEERYSPTFRLRLVLNQGQDYHDNVRQGAAMGLRYILHSPRITNDARSQIEKCLSDCIDSPNKVDFRTYQVRLLPDSTPGEATFELRRGLLWMVKETTAMAPYIDLYQTVSTIFKRLLSAVSFFESYPLRLMSPEDHRGVLGNYISRGFDLFLWTRYNPPIDVGQVHARWLEVIDRTTPNSMGISFPLFQHTCVVLPVIYHEYLHYLGEKNEGKVWLCESLFQKNLIAELAPSDDSAIDVYETEIRRLLVELVGIENLKLLQRDAYDNDFLLYLNGLITSLYGPKLTEAQAKVQAENAVNAENDNIKSENNRIKWCPKIKWPLLSSLEGMDQRNEIFEIVKRQKMQRNTVQKKEIDAIIAESESVHKLSQWRLYTQRPGASHVLFAQAPDTIYSLQTLVDAARQGNLSADMLNLLKGAGFLSDTEFFQDK